MDIYKVTTNIKPNIIFKCSSIYNIMRVDRRFHIKCYMVETKKNGIINNVLILDSFHPNAKSIDKQYKKHSFKFKPPNKSLLCIPPLFRNKKFIKEVSVEMLNYYISTWNLNDCYYIPHQDLFDVTQNGDQYDRFKFNCG